ncbi:MAG: COX15/CtaA family protein [Planctomycetota bacterium]|jgi:cytochrome c oxidase assembly protein subunit 15
MESLSIPEQAIPQQAGPLETSGIAAEPVRRGLYRYSVLVVIWCFVNIKLGAMVTSTNSGMAFPTWPHSDGYWLWPVDMDVMSRFLEHFHRLWGAALGMFAIGLLVWVWCADNRRWLHKLVLGILLLITIEGVVGGTGVLDNLPTLNSVTHGVLAQVLLCCLTLVAFCLSGGWRDRVACAAGMVRTTRTLTIIALSLVVLQTLLGAILRHTNNQYALWIHVGFAMVVSFAILIAAAHSSSRFSGVRGFRQLCRITLSILLMQLILGFVTLAIRDPKHEASTESLGRAAVQTAHVLVGASLLLVATLLVARAHRNLAPRQ